MTLILEWDSRELKRWSDDKRMTEALKSALQKSGNRALRDMKASSQKGVRGKKRLGVAKVNDSLRIVFPRGKQTIGSLEWRMNVSGKLVPLSNYPYRTTRRGVSVKVNTSEGYKLIRHAFVARMRSGHVGIFKRAFPGAPRLPIVEAKYSTKVSDVFKDHGMISGVYARAQRTFNRDFAKLLPMELEKL